MPPRPCFACVWNLTNKVLDSPTSMLSSTILHSRYHARLACSSIIQVHLSEPTAIALLLASKLSCSWALSCSTRSTSSTLATRASRQRATSTASTSLSTKALSLSCVHKSKQCTLSGCSACTSVCSWKHHGMIRLPYSRHCQFFHSDCSFMLKGRCTLVVSLRQRLVHSVSISRRSMASARDLHCTLSSAAFLLAFPALDQKISRTVHTLKGHSMK